MSTPRRAPLGRFFIYAIFVIVEIAVLFMIIGPNQVKSYTNLDVAPMVLVSLVPLFFHVGLAIPNKQSRIGLWVLAVICLALALGTLNTRFIYDQFVAPNLPLY